MQALHYSAEEMRKSVQTTYIENPLSDMLSDEAYHNYSTYSGRDGIELLPYLLLYLASQIYDKQGSGKDCKKFIVFHVIL